MSRLVKFVGSGIGLATEAVAARKARSPSTTQAQEGETVAVESSRQTQGESNLPEYQERAQGDEHLEGEVENDENDWDLDDAATEYTSQRHDAGTNRPESDVGEIIQTFVHDHPPPAYTAERPGIGQLPFPVIVPQRRPQNKSRGFVRAYAPVLSDCGIDQKTFIDFLESFDKASKASPVFQVVNVACFAVGFVPLLSAQIVSTVVGTASLAATEVQKRKRANNFLDEMNEKLFKPHGLFCLIMSFKPESNSRVETVDISKTILKSITSPNSSSLRTTLKSSSSKTYGELRLPQSAPLIFPALDTATPDEKQNALKKSTKFIADYYDRRGQAMFDARNPDSSLSIPQTQKFASRYSDPNHPAVNGSLISLVTGGYIDPNRIKSGLSGSSGQQSGGLGRGRGLLPSRSGGLLVPNRRSEMKENMQQGRRYGITGRILRQDILYLMVVNMPSQEEINDALTQMRA
ncbi:hypothetical protein MMC14_005950 [Varicellaria rhodocarpa]|nr:hypothetical protein [Varicellaria rhodocarpa]